MNKQILLIALTVTMLGILVTTAIPSVHAPGPSSGNGTLHMYSDSGCSNLLPQAGGIKGYVMPATGTSIWIQITGITEVPDGGITILIQFSGEPNEFISGTVSSGTTNCIEWVVGTFGGVLQSTPLTCATGPVSYGPASDTSVNDFYFTDSNGGSDGGHFYWGTGCSTTTLLTTSISTTVYDTGTTVATTGGSTIPPATAYAGDSFYDTATITYSGPTPTGTVTYYFYTSHDCSGTPTTQDVTVAGDGSVPNSAATGALGVGSYSFQASYGGDGNYQPSGMSACEPFDPVAFAPVAPQVTKTATPSLTITYGWTITKLCSFDNVHWSSSCSEDTKSSSVTVYYKVTVTHDAGTLGNWQVTGDIYVTNPNLGSFAYTSVSDSIVDSATHTTTDAVASCPVSTGSDAAYQNTGTFNPSGGTIPAGDTVDFPYTCTYSAAPSVDGEVNKVTVSWVDQTISFTDNGITHSASLAGGSQTAFSTDWTWSTVTPTVKDGSVTVTDTNFGTPGTIGTASVSPTACTTSAAGVTCTDFTGPPAGTTFAYSKTYTIPVDQCLNVQNTSKFTTSDTATTGQATSTVTICPQVKGFLTMGFWKNPNGQGIIKNQASSGVCPSVAYLRQFTPFQDLSTTSTCTLVASYVSTVIGAATCSSSTATCNKMLKAQMLATALDVYFSASTGTSCNISGTGAPFCGGDLIAGYNGGVTVFLGGVKIDLTNIPCAADGGTCTPGSVSSCFGGATCMTVMQMLAFQNSVSNVGGTTWYGQVKAKQVLAKDAFDAINNNLAFTC